MHDDWCQGDIHLSMCFHYTAFKTPHHNPQHDAWRRLVFLLTEERCGSGVVEKLDKRTDVNSPPLPVAKLLKTFLRISLGVLCVKEILLNQICQNSAGIP